MGEEAFFLSQKFSYLSIAFTFILYLLSGHWLFGLLCGLSIIWAVILEFWHGTKKHGLLHEIKETAFALAIALAIWFGAGFVLQTPSPLNAIVSCSMMPNIQRGDLVVLAGGEIAAPQVEVEDVSTIGEAIVMRSKSEVARLKGSLYAQCAQQQIPICAEFIQNPQEFSEKHGAITFGYEKCEMVYPKTGEKKYGPCVGWIEINNIRYYANMSNDVVVYTPKESEYYASIGDIIHRAYIKLKTKEKTYILTKGDNNPVFDIQVYDAAKKAGNLPVESERIKGKVVLSIPAIGYLKLFISPVGITTPEGCDRYFVSTLRS
ncbi:MAG: hypothetical protein N3G80_01430 [Candidatus Micrarchaeota archaeon]|nr:hypothetical protein [Candidatus Micrarchaeota archaeon]